MLRKSSFLLALLLSSACASPPAPTAQDVAVVSGVAAAQPEPFAEDVIEEEIVHPALTACLYEVSEASRGEVIAGLQAWATILKPWREIEVVPDATDCNLTVFEVGPHSGLCASDDAAGCTRQIGGLGEDDPSVEVFLYRGNYESYATGATMHEVGHLLGLTHKDGGLMQASWPDDFQSADWTTPDSETLDRLETIVGVALR